MKTRFLIWLLTPALLLRVLAAPGPANPETPTPPAAKPGASASEGPMYVFPLKTEVTRVTVALMRRALKEAERNGAGSFVIDMDTPGGRLDATETLLEMLRKTKLPTYTFVNPNAISAGALISLATKKIYMRPDSVIGAAAIVSGSGEDLQETMQLKGNSFLTAKMRAVCEENGHNPAIAEAFIVKDRELKMGETVIDSKETLLSLNGPEAVRLYDGKPLLAAGLVENLAGLAKSAHLSATMVIVEPTGFEEIATWLAIFAPLLMVGGIVGAYIEIKTPGFGIPGIASIICFALFFGGQMIAGFAGYESVFVFILGLVLVVIEVFVVPGTIVPGLVGMLLMLGSLVWAMVDRWPGTTGMPSSDDLKTPMLNLVIAFAGTAILIALLAKILPKTALYNRLVLGTASADGPAVSIPIVNLTVKVGDLGTATTTLRPAGKAAFAGEVHDVVTLGDFITAGSPVRVVETDGVRVVVQQA